MSYCGVVLLPEDILTEIFIRLPVKSIGKSRCVSKRWNSLLTSPRFIKTHLARSHQKKLLLLPKDPSLFTFTLRPDGVAEGTFKKRVSVPTLDEYSTLVGHCNGLVLISTGERCHLLMNPTTLEHSRLPESPNFALGPSEIRIGHEYGFGYDSSSDDYKVVNFFVVCNIADNRLLDPSFCQIFADIYSVKKKCWRRVDLDWPPSLIAGGTNGGAGVFVNGALHWLSIYPNDVICAIDLGSEKCYEIPSLHGGKHNYVDRLVVSKGSCLGIVCWDKDEARIDIWTMNKYGMAESWTKNVYVVVGYQDIIGKRPWCWRDALVIQYTDKLTFYSFNDETSFSMTLDTTTINNLLEGGQRVDGLMFSETLVSPHHFDTTQQHKDEERRRIVLNNVSMETVVDAWVGEFVKMKTKVKSRRLSLFNVIIQNLQKESQVLMNNQSSKQQLTSSSSDFRSADASTTAAIDESSLSEEPTIFLLMDRFAPC